MGDFGAGSGNQKGTKNIDFIDLFSEKDHICITNCRTYGYANFSVSEVRR